MVGALALGGTITFVALNGRGPDGGPGTGASPEADPGAAPEGGARPETSAQLKAKAGRIFEEAERYAKEHPDDYGALIERFRSVAKEAEGTEYAQKAAGRAKEIENARVSAVAQAWGVLEGKVSELVEAGRFGEALTSIESLEEIPENLKSHVDEELVEQLRTSLEEQARQDLESLRGKAEALTKDGKFAEARKLFAKAAAFGLSSIREAAGKALEELDALEASATEEAREQAEELYGDAFARVEGLVRERKYHLALRRCDAFAEDERYQPILERVRRDRSDIERVKAVFDAVISALPAQVGRPFSINRITGKLKEIKDGKLVISARGAEFAQPVTALSAKDVSGLAAPAMRKLGGQGSLALAVFWLYEGQKKALGTIRDHLREAGAAGIDVARYTALCDSLEKGKVESAAESLFGRAVRSLESKRWESCLELLAKLKEDYGATQFVRENGERIAGIEEKAAAGKRTPLSSLEEGLVLWLNTQKGVTTQAGGTVSRWEDLSGKGNHASQSAGARMPRFLRRGRSGVVLFDGEDDLLNVVHSQSLDITREMTVAFRMRLEETATGRNQSIIGKYTWVGGRRTWHIHYSGKDKKVGFHVWGPGGQPQDSVVPGGRLPAKTWCHLAAVFKPRGIGLYVNGQLAAQKEAALTSLSSFPTVPLQIGWIRGGSERDYFKGAIDDIRIYRRVLTPKEIAGLAASRSDDIDSPSE